MDKARIGISVNLLGALSFFMALFVGYFPLLLFVGYVLLIENDAWLRRTAFKALLTIVVFSVLYTFIHFIPDVLDWINRIAILGGEGIDFSKVNGMFHILSGLLELIKTVLLLMLAFKALGKKTLRVPFVDDLLDKFM